MSRGGAVVIAGALLAAACTVMNGLSVTTTPTDPEGTSSSSSGKVPNGTSSSGVVVVGPDPTKCVLAKEPAKPKASDPGGTDITLTYAMKQMVPNNVGTPFGLDLDGLCTCFTPVGASAPGPDACKRGTSACDGEPNTGLDNGGAVLFKQIVNQGGVNLVDIQNSDVGAGRVGLLIHIEGYNGLANDDDIKVKFIRSPGISGGPKVGTVEQWPDSDDFFSSTEAYVVTYTQKVKLENGGIGDQVIKALVARFDEVEVPFLIGTPKPAKMTGAIVTGAIVEGNIIPELIVAGRSNTHELVQSTGQVSYGGFHLCDSLYNGDGKYAGFGSAACALSDMPTDPAKTGDLTTPCDAMSFGVKMLMIPADPVLGPKGALIDPGDPCDGAPGYPLACPNP